MGVRRKSDRRGARWCQRMGRSDAWSALIPGEEVCVGAGGVRGGEVGQAMVSVFSGMSGDNVLNCAIEPECVGRLFVVCS